MENAGKLHKKIVTAQFRHAISAVDIQEGGTQDPAVWPSGSSRITAPAPQIELASGSPARCAAVMASADPVASSPPVIRAAGTKITRVSGILPLRPSWYAKPTSQRPLKIARLTMTSPMPTLGSQTPERARTRPTTGRDKVRSGHRRKDQSSGRLSIVSHR